MCVSVREQDNTNLHPNQLFAVGVQGFRTTIFQLTLSFADNIVPLSNGMPVSGFVDAQGYTYFKFLTNDTQSPVTVVLTRLSGDPDLVIRNGACGWCVGVGVTCACVGCASVGFACWALHVPLRCALCMEGCAVRHWSVLFAPT
jgi:hypothetical protein